RGTATIGGVFGPVMVLWFSCLALLALPHLIEDPRVLGALSPTHAFTFLNHHGHRSLLVLGGVFLVVTGGEALYADLGHFGRRPIQRTWFLFVLPALVVHYFGQGALLVAHPEAIENPFYLLAPSWALYPLVVLATLATVIASQAVITGAFSLTHQAIQLGYLPRVEIRHTSSSHIGQIFVPVVNWILLISTVGLVVGFRSSAGLANAYGVAVVTTMLITTVLGFVCARMVWSWSLWAAAGASLSFLVVDLGFLSANILKIPSGGWLPLVVAALMYFLMATWRKGHEAIRRRLSGHRLDFRPFLEDLAGHDVKRVSGLAVFLDGNPDGVPNTLLQNIKHNHVVHEQVVLLTIQVHETPKVSSDERLEIVALQSGFFRAIAHYGFMEQPNIPALLREAREEGVRYEGAHETSFFLGRENLVRGKHHTMSWWRESLFLFLARNQRAADEYFGLPTNRVVELGQQIPV
ncbi:MAG TPA: potassium transporter Kup, partial [Planctomycetes bacterium]|nr:potassium transporter Kup [Planctomycetota bacterium]